MLHGFDASKFALGVLCKRSHAWEGTGQSLRRISNGDCTECNKLRGNRHYAQVNQPIRREAAKVRRQAEEELKRSLAQMLIDAGVDAAKYKLTLVCIRGHYWNDTQYSLRYSRGGCVGCVKHQYESLDEATKERYKQTQAKWKERNRETILAKKRQYHRKNREAISLKNKQHYRENKELYRHRAHANYLKRRSKHRAYAKRYRATAQGRDVFKAAYYRRKARVLQAHTAHFSAADLQSQFKLFKDRCVYCGKASNLTVDHFIPLANGGSNCLSNIVPACFSCNASKQDSDPLEWFKRQAIYSDRKWKFILKQLGKTPENYNQIPLL